MRHGERSEHQIRSVKPEPARVAPPQPSTGTQVPAYQRSGFREPARFGPHQREDRPDPPGWHRVRPRGQPSGSPSRRRPGTATATRPRSSRPPADPHPPGIREQLVPDGPSKPKPLRHEAGSSKAEDRPVRRLRGEDRLRPLRSRWTSRSQQGRQALNAAAALTTYAQGDQGGMGRQAHAPSERNPSAWAFWRRRHADQQEPAL